MKHLNKHESLTIDRLKAVHKADREMSGHFRPMTHNSKTVYNRARSKRISYEENYT